MVWVVGGGGGGREEGSAAGGIGEACLMATSAAETDDGSANCSCWEVGAGYDDNEVS